MESEYSILPVCVLAFVPIRRNCYSDGGAAHFSFCADVFFTVCYTGVYYYNAGAYRDLLSAFSADVDFHKDGVVYNYI